MLKPLIATVLICAVTSVAQAAIPVYGFLVKNRYPHDPQAFTQGLVYHDGYLYESTGLHGRSSIRKVELGTGKVLRKAALPQEVFGEGSAIVGNELITLTWQSQVGYVFDLHTFKLKHTFQYPGEGWGLTGDGRQLYLSDGSATIRILDARTRKQLRTIEVRAEGRPLARLNELELVGKELFANIWGTDVIARIDPASGNVMGWINLTGLLPAAQRPQGEVDAVLNGIAWDDKRKRLFVTGKMWPTLFEIELVPLLRR